MSLYGVARNAPSLAILHNNSMKTKRRLSNPTHTNNINAEEKRLNYETQKIVCPTELEQNINFVENLRTIYVNPLH